MIEIARSPHYLPPGADFLLLTPTQQPHAYANVDRMFATRVIPRGPTTRDLPRAPKPRITYTAANATRSIEDYLSRACVSGLLVLHRGRIVLERYALGLTPERRWSSMSMVKSLTSTLVGTALQDGFIASLDDPVSTHVAAVRGTAYDAVRIRDLLTMSSGVDWNEDYTDRQSHVNRYSRALGERDAGGVLRLLATLARAHPPGTHFHYNTGDTFLLGCLLTSATGETLAGYMSRRLWQPLGMEQDGFYTLESENGQEIGGSRAGFTLRDLGRFGQFLCDGGRIDGRALLPGTWVAEAGRPAFALNPAENSFGATGYGYSWWLDGTGAMAAVGFAGQSLVIDRARQLVTVTLSARPQPPYDAPYGIDFRAERTAFQHALNAALAG